MLIVDGKVYCFFFKNADTYCLYSERKQTKVALKNPNEMDVTGKVLVDLPAMMQTPYIFLEIKIKTSLVTSGCAFVLNFY